MARLHAPSTLIDAVGGRPLADAELADGGWAVLTLREFVISDADGEPVVRRPWHEVARGSWDGGERSLTVTWVNGDEATFTATEQMTRDFPGLFRERVDSSMVLVESEQVPGGGTIRGAIRRTPDGLISQITGEGRLRQGAALDRQVDELERRIREAVGLD